MKGLRLAVFIVLGIGTSTTFAFVVGIAWSVWRGRNLRPAEVQILYVERAKPAPSAAPTVPSAALSAR